jgi:hypothetical protein
MQKYQIYSSPVSQAFSFRKTLCNDLLDLWVNHWTSSCSSSSSSSSLPSLLKIPLSTVSIIHSANYDLQTILTKEVIMIFRDGSKVDKCNILNHFQQMNE